MTTAKQNVNEMIFKTLKTKADKPARYAEQLRELGYDVKVDNKWDDYWSVDCLTLRKGDSGPVWVNLRGCRYVEKLDNIKRIDFVNYLATLDERKAKAKRMRAHDDIEQRHERWVKTMTVRVHHGNGPWQYDYETVNRRVHNVIDENHVISRYRHLKEEAEARGHAWYGNGEDDYEIKWAEKCLADAEAHVEKLWRQLEEAERAVEGRRADVQAAVDRKAEGRMELDAFLKAHGVR